MKIPWRAANEGPPVPEEQYQERFWRRRLDGIGLDTATNEFLAIEFKRTQDARSNYVERATAVAKEQYKSLLAGLQSVGQVKEWKVQQKVFVVKPSRLDGAIKGVFATRAPHMPTPVGFSLCKLDRIEGHMLQLSGVELVDCTPVQSTISSRSFRPTTRLRTTKRCAIRWGICLKRMSSSKCICQTPPLPTWDC